MAYAAGVMRGLIVDYVRRRHAQKRGGLFELTSMETAAGGITDAQELTRVSDALSDLDTVDPALAQVVDLKFFCGFTFAEIWSDAGRLGTHGAASVGEGPPVSVSLAPGPRSPGVTARGRMEPVISC